MAQAEEKRICGVIRPISAAGEIYTAEHWLVVHDVIQKALEPTGFEVRLVSESKSAGIIVADIIKNLYQDEIVVCDVSSHNPNVMFELGLRVAFQKPVVIIKDKNTNFSFDISAIRHVEYDRSLRIDQAERFISDLQEAVGATLVEVKSEDYRGYLQQYGPYEVTKIRAQSITLGEIADEMKEIKRQMIFQRQALHDPNRLEIDLKYNGMVQNYVYMTVNPHSVELIAENVGRVSGVASARLALRRKSSSLLRIDLEPADPAELDRVAQEALAVARQFDASIHLGI